MSELRDRKSYVSLDEEHEMSVRNSKRSSEETEEEDLRQQFADADPDYVGSLREKIFSFCEYNKEGTFLQSDPRLMKLSFWYQATSITLILINTITFIITTEPRYHDTTPVWSLVFDIIAVVFFTIDWFLRLACAPSKMAFLKNTFNIFDFLSFAPTYVEWALHHQSSSISMLRFLRLFRVFRLFRLIRFSPTLKIAVKAIAESKEGFILLCMVILVNLVFFSTTMYFVEGSYCWFDEGSQSWLYLANNSTSPFQSITSTFWWNIVSISTVGYGDVVPKTAGGKIVAAIAMVFGIILLAFPIAIFGTNFHTMYTDWKEKSRTDAKQKKAKSASAKTRVDVLLRKSAEIYRIQVRLQELQDETEECHQKISEHLQEMQELLQ